MGGVPLGINVSKFPPGFFNENQIKGLDSRLGRKRASQKNISGIEDAPPGLSLQRNDSVQSQLSHYDTSLSKDKFNFLGGGTLPKVLEMPGLQAIEVTSSGNEFSS